MENNRKGGAIILSQARKINFKPLNKINASECNNKVEVEG